MKLRKPQPNPPILLLAKKLIEINNINSETLENMRPVDFGREGYDRMNDFYLELINKLYLHNSSELYDVRA